MSAQTLLILEELIAQPLEWRYGYDLSRETDLKAGTLYPILMRLTKHKLLEAQWVATEQGRPPRHMYRLTPRGVEFAKQKLAKPSRRTSFRSALSKGSA